MSYYETVAGLPSHGVTYARLMERLRGVQEDAAMLAHITRAQGGRKDNAIADGWIAVSELMKRMQYQVTELAKARMQ